MTLILVIKPCVSPLAAGPRFYSHCLCLRAKVLVSYRRPYPGGSDPEEGPRSPADKLLGKYSASHFQLCLVPEEPVHGAGQLLPGSGERKATTVLISVFRRSLSYHVCLCVQKFFNPRVLRDGSFQGINFNRFMVTDRAIYLGEHIDLLVFLFKILLFKGKTNHSLV